MANMVTCVVELVLHSQIILLWQQFKISMETALKQCAALLKAYFFLKPLALRVNQFQPHLKFSTTN